MSPLFREQCLVNAIQAASQAYSAFQKAGDTIMSHLTWCMLCDLSDQLAELWS